MNIKPIHNTNYAITDNGEVISYYKGNTKLKIYTGDRYSKVSLSIQGKSVTKLVHRLVAEAFIPNPNKLPQINHIDGNKHNNSVTNLEWVSASNNMKHAYRTGLQTPRVKLVKTSNHKNISKDKGRWRYRKMVNKVEVTKYFDTEEEAYQYKLSQQ